MSLSPIITIFSQPLWGMVSDYTQNPKRMLLIAQISTITIALFYSTIQSFSMLIFVVVLLATTQSALIPLSDSITLGYVQKVNGNYGSIRLFGSLGYAIAVFCAGRLADLFSLKIIFYVFAFLLFIGICISIVLPKSVPVKNREPIRKGLPILLSQKRFILFLLFTIVVFGPVNANNTYFGLYIQSLGGTLTGVGIAFLISAGSEAPFMQYAKKLIDKYGIYNILMVTAFVSALRWFFYFTNPPLLTIYISSLAQGLSVGLFVPAALHYVKEQAPDTYRATAVTLYGALGLGLGEWFCTFLSGFIADQFEIKSIYLLFGLLSLSGVGLMQYLKLHSKVNDKKGIAS